MRRSPGYWTSERIDEAFDVVQLELGKTPTFIEFSRRFATAARAIMEGQYNGSIKGWNPYLALRGAKPNNVPGKWTKESVDRAFEEQEKLLGRPPTAKEFVRAYGGAVAMILSGRYDASVSNYADYLAHRGLTPRLVSWTSAAVDTAFETLSTKLGHPPSLVEFRQETGGAYAFILSGGYDRDVRSWKDFAQRKGNPNVGREHWTPEKIDVAFDRLRAELGRTPNYNEFSSGCQGALGAIEKGRYDPEITTYIEFIDHRGAERPNMRRRWTPQIIDETFDALAVEIGRIPTWDEVSDRFSGLIVALNRGRYHPHVRTYGDYLVHRNIHKTGQSRNGLREISSLLDEFGRQEI